jgi:hypothetical protein
MLSRSESSTYALRCLIRCLIRCFRRIEAFYVLAISRCIKCNFTGSYYFKYLTVSSLYQGTQCQNLVARTPKAYSRKTCLFHCCVFVLVAVVVAAAIGWLLYIDAWHNISGGSVYCCYSHWQCCCLIWCWFLFLIFVVAPFFNIVEPVLHPFLYEAQPEPNFRPSVF